MTFKISDAEYEKLKQRVADGKVYLENRWDSLDEDVHNAIALWMELSNQLFEQMCIRGVFQEVPTHEEVLASAEARLERVRMQMIRKGLLKPTKERRKLTDVQNGFQGRPLFATS